MENGYERRPVEWVREFLKGDPWSRQEDILQALAEHARVTVRSCHGVGKTWTAASAALWFLYTREPALVLTTAPTHRQMREVLWKEIRRQHRRMFAEGMPACGIYLKGEIRETALRLADDRFALGLTTDEPDRFQGFHAPHILVVVDEASGVNEEIFAAIEGVLTTEEAKLLLIGNPLHARGAFYKSHRKGAWRRFAISAFDSPNLAGVDLCGPESVGSRPPRPGLVTAQWVADRRDEWGEDSPLYQSRVLGEFPDQACDALFPRSWLEAAVARRRTAPLEDGPVRFGVDVARFGDCETVVCVRQGNAVRALHAWRKADLMESVGRIRALAAEWEPVCILVDAAGLGAGVADRLRELENRRVLEVNVGVSATDGERFSLLRDELFFGLRDRFRDGEISLPADQVLLDQLAALTYEIDERGKQRVTAKSELRRQGLASPDRADALALAFMPVRTPRVIAFAGRPR